MKKWTVGELQALRVASRFLIGVGAIAIILILALLPDSTPEQKTSDAHKNDRRDGIIVLIVGVAFVGVGWKLRSFRKKYERQTGQSSKPFGWIP
jgi:hypothetical protein